MSISILKQNGRLLYDYNTYWTKERQNEIEESGILMDSMTQDMRYSQSLDCLSLFCVFFSISVNRFNYIKKGRSMRHFFDRL